MVGEVCFRSKVFVRINVSLIISLAASCNELSCFSGKFVGGVIGNQSVFCAPPAFDCVVDSVAVPGSEDVAGAAESHGQADVPVPAKWGVKSCEFSRLRNELDLMIALESIEGREMSASGWDCSEDFPG